jgi:hypothetical protein
MQFKVGKISVRLHWKDKRGSRRLASESCKYLSIVGSINNVCLVPRARDQVVFFYSPSVSVSIAALRVENYLIGCKKVK